MAIRADLSPYVTPTSHGTSIFFTPDKLGVNLGLWINENSIVTSSGKVTALNSNSPAITLQLNQTANPPATFPNLVTNARNGRSGIMNSATNGDQSVSMQLHSPINASLLAYDYNTPFTMFGSYLMQQYAQIGGIGTTTGGNTGWIFNNADHLNIGTGIPLSFWLINNYNTNDLWVIQSSIILAQGQVVNYVFSYDGTGINGFTLYINGVKDTNVHTNPYSGVNSANPAGTPTHPLYYPISAFSQCSQNVYLETVCTIAGYALTPAQISGAVQYLNNRWY